ncbi:unnamed protein product [Linum tenue]|uniref:Uncharacterized protein n=1 Tax=Linum tenue TaxID=586396 RepID=A0AAV0HC25_9ROSI|nr:unnamed protein product [Linum tenue]
MQLRWIRNTSKDYNPCERMGHCKIRGKVC